MSSPAPRAPRKAFLSLDVWAVVLSFALALLVRIGFIKTVPW